MPLTAEDVAAIETVAHYTHDEDQCYLMLYGAHAAPARLFFGAHAEAATKQLSRGVCHALVRAGEGVFDTIPIEADYTVGDMKLWLKTHKNKDPNEYDLVGPKGVWKMGAGSEVLGDDIVIADVMGPRFEGKWLMQLSLFPKKKNESTGEMESTFETIEEWVPPPPEEAWESEREREIEEAERDDD